MKVNNLHQFSSDEERLILDAVLCKICSYEDENGEVEHLSKRERNEYEMILDIYRFF